MEQLEQRVDSLQSQLERLKEQLAKIDFVPRKDFSEAPIFRELNHFPMVNSPDVPWRVA